MAVDCVCVCVCVWRGGDHNTFGVLVVIVTTELMSTDGADGLRLMVKKLVKY